MKLKFDRIISIATLLGAVVTVVLVLRKPEPVGHPQTPAAIAANAQSFGDKIEQLEQAPPPRSTSAISYESGTPQGSVPTPRPVSTESAPPKAEVRINSAEISAALAQATGAVGAGELTPDSNIGSSAPTIKDQQVSFEGDVVHGQFLTEIAGKDVWVTVSGHLASKDGFASFEPTEFKVGDLNVPVSLVNPALQKKLSEQRDRLKLPDYVGGVKVENGELVVQKK